MVLRPLFQGCLYGIREIIAFNYPYSRSYCNPLGEWIPKNRIFKNLLLSLFTLRLLLYCEFDQPFQTLVSTKNYQKNVMRKIEIENCKSCKVTCCCSFFSCSLGCIGGSGLPKSLVYIKEKYQQSHYPNLYSLSSKSWLQLVSGILPISNVESYNLGGDKTGSHKR